MAYYNNLLNMGEPVNVQALPQPLLTSPFDYTDTGLLPIDIPTYTTPTPQPYTPIQPGPFGVQPVAPVAPITLVRDDGDFTDEVEVSQPENAFSGLNPGRTTALSLMSAFAPGLLGTALGAFNSYNGYAAQSFNQSLANVDRSLAEALSESLGFGYSEGIGGYGRSGRGGYTGAMDYTDPGVAGRARGIARSALNAAMGYDPAGYSFGMDRDFGYEDISQSDVDTSNTGYDVDPDFGNEDISASDVGGPGDQDDGGGGFGAGDADDGAGGGHGY